MALMISDASKMKPYRFSKTNLDASEATYPVFIDLVVQMAATLRLSHAAHRGAAEVLIIIIIIIYIIKQLI